MVLPYAFDTNDMQFFHTNRFCGAGDFASYVIDAFSWLHREGAHAPKIMSIGFHLRMIGQPGRIAALHKILGHIADRGNVRNCATDRHHQPLARTVPRELMFKGLRPIDGDRVASCPRRRRPQDRWRRATKTLSCYSRDLASRIGTLDGSQSKPP